MKAAKIIIRPLIKDFGQYRTIRVFPFIENIRRSYYEENNTQVTDSNKNDIPGDGDGKATIDDATNIQKYLAGFKISYPIGEYIKT